jgi:hypothetical protein
MRLPSREIMPGVEHRQHKQQQGGEFPSIRRPSQDAAAKFHSARNKAFTAWVEVTGVAMAA